MMSTMNELVPEYPVRFFAIDAWVWLIEDSAERVGVSASVLPAAEWTAFIELYVDTIKSDVDRRIGSVYRLRWEADGSWYTELGNDILPPLAILQSRFQDCVEWAAGQAMASSEFFRLMRLCHEVKDLSGMPLEEMV